MTAVVRPVCIYHADLGDSGVAVLLIAEVVLTELYIVVVHSKTELVNEGVQTLLVEVDEALEGLDGLWYLVVCVECVHLVKGSLTALNGVYHVRLEAFEVGVGDTARNDVHSRVSHAAALALTEYLYTLLTAVGTLVELTWEVLDREHSVALLKRGELVVYDVNCGFGENRRYRGFEVSLAELIRVVAVEDAYTLDIESQGRPDVAEDRLCLNGEFGLFFCIDSEYSHIIFSLYVKNYVKRGNIGKYSRFGSIAVLRRDASEAAVIAYTFYCNIKNLITQTFF